VNVTIIKVIAVTLLFIAGLSSASAGESTYPKCALHSLKKSSKVQFSISNPSKQAWRLLKWHTPFDAWFSEFIRVTLAGEPVIYEGALAKRGQPDDEDYLIIEAGEEVGIELELELELSEAFRLTSGQYRVELEPLYFFLNREYLNQESFRTLEKPRAYKVYCNTATLNIE